MFYDIGEQFYQMLFLHIFEYLLHNLIPLFYHNINIIQVSAMIPDNIYFLPLFKND